MYPFESNVDLLYPKAEIVMLKQMTLKNVTVFPDADLQFASGLNVIVGENGCGKTHLLKVAYALIAASASHG
jgi:predicted ATP-dependent endonuclease of OLD family